ncbi:hypothetical protein GBAR_LOCUS15958 [Geodia barretti]|uniref:Uncharacterized protein n=1 Tax=Geodia barretti TaxID=519541 RepID=A0AA35SF33_GEOBA|nr:hypothetical protein GBAR_LOCUS15958 [Geodia barretti]
MAPSTHCQIRRHEHRLSEVALSDREAAHAITECLTYLNLPPPSPPSLTANPHDNALSHIISWLKTHTALPNDCIIH